MSAPTNAPSAGKVLTTLREDGTRIWMRPKLARGRFLNRRRVVGYTLIVLFLILPFVYVGKHPAILLDVSARKFHLFGATFLPTDSALLMLLMLSIFLTVFWLTALVGRVWCGWGCPQTVYMELIFRPIETFFEGSLGQQRKMDQAKRIPARRLVKYAVFFIIAFILGNQFLAYFVGWKQLAVWMSHAPWEQPGGFAVMAVTTGLVFFDFAYFREQMCTVICPYARFQSALLDRDSLIVAYDHVRGEARKKVKQRTTNDGSGDCIDCHACVTTCPTGIDIRDGLQLECINCTQCIDACDQIMDRIGRPRGLIRLSSQRAIETSTRSRTHLIRPRTVAYPAIIVLLVGLMGFIVQSKGTADVTVLRQLNAPFVLTDDSAVRNQLRIKVVNRAPSERTYTMSIPGVDAGQILAPQFPLRVAEDDVITTPVFVTLPINRFDDGRLDIVVKVEDGEGFSTEVPFVLLGPEAQP